MECYFHEDVLFYLLQCIMMQTIYTYITTCYAMFQYVRTARLDGTVPHRAAVMYPDWRIRSPASRVTRPPDNVTV